MLVFNHCHHHPLTAILLPVVLLFPTTLTHILPPGGLSLLFKDLEQILATR